MSDLIDREYAIKRFCEDGTYLERHGVGMMTLCEAKQRAVDLIESFPSAQPVNYGSTKSDSSSQLKLNNDLISRQAAIDAMRKLQKWNIMREDYKNVGFSYDDVMFTLEKLTSAQTEHKKGRWIWWYEEAFTEHATEYTPHCKCSECGRECAPSVATYSNFCRNCGADMRGESDE